MSIALVLVLSASFVISGFLSSSNQLSTRTIDVDSIGTLSYEEKVEKLRSQFDTIDMTEDDGNYYFNGEMVIDQYNLLSTNYEGENVKNNYSSVINKNNETIKIGKNVVVNGEIVSTTSDCFTTRYDASLDKCFWWTKTEMKLMLYLN